MNRAQPPSFLNMLWFSSHKASPFSEYSYIIMAEENGVCHVNGEPEVVDGDLQNGERDEDDKGYDI